MTTIEEVLIDYIIDHWWNGLRPGRLSASAAVVAAFEAEGFTVQNRNGEQVIPRDQTRAALVFALRQSYFADQDQGVKAIYQGERDFRVAEINQRLSSIGNEETGISSEKTDLEGVSF